MIRWGITANSHDAAVAVFDGKEIKFAAHAERSSGKKNDKFLNSTIISQALEYGEPDEVHWYETQWLKRLRQIKSGQYQLAFNKESPRTTLANLGVKTRPYFCDESFMFPKSTPAFVNHRHHASHAAAGYFTSPYQDAAVLVIDSIGEFETLTMWKGQGRDLKQVYSQGYPHSIGLWYSAMTQRIGLKPN